MTARLAGFARAKAGAGIVCLLNREPVWAEMAECSKPRAHPHRHARNRTPTINRSLMPFLSRVARAVIRDAAQQTTQHPQAEPEPCSYEAEIAAIVGRYGAAIARRATAQHAKGANRGDHLGLDGTAAQRDFGRAEAAQGQSRRPSAEALTVCRRLAAVTSFPPSLLCAALAARKADRVRLLGRIEGEPKQGARAPLGRRSHRRPRNAPPRFVKIVFLRFDGMGLRRLDFPAHSFACVSLNIRGFFI